MTYRRSVILRLTDNGRTAVSRWAFLSRNSAFHLAVTLTFNLWPLRSLQQFKLAR